MSVVKVNSEVVQKFRALLQAEIDHVNQDSQSAIDDNLLLMSHSDARITEAYETILKVVNLEVYLEDSENRELEFCLAQFHYHDKL